MNGNNRNRITDREILRNYLFGGRAKVTLQSPSGVHHTYEFRKPRDASEFPEDVFFVYTLTHTHRYIYVGMVECNKFRCTMHSRFREYTDICKGAVYILRIVNEPTLLTTTAMQIFHEGTCSMCGRALTDPISIKYGLAPTCRMRLNNANRITTKYKEKVS